MRLMKSLLVLSALFTWSTSVSAQGAGGGAMSVCRTDLATFCQGVEAGGGKKSKCLMENQAKLSPECASSIQARADQRADRKAEALNAPVPSGTASAAPTAAKPAAAGAAPASSGQPQKRMAACRADMKTLCGDVPRGGGVRIACLRDNVTKVSPDCAAAMASMPLRRRAAAPATNAAAANAAATPAPAATPTPAAPKQ
jgi:hypothetical protein